MYAMRSLERVSIKFSNKKKIDELSQKVVDVEAEFGDEGFPNQPAYQHFLYRQLGLLHHEMVCYLTEEHNREIYMHIQRAEIAYNKGEPLPKYPGDLYEKLVCLRRKCGEAEKAYLAEFSDLKQVKKEELENYESGVKHDDGNKQYGIEMLIQEKKNCKMEPQDDHGTLVIQSLKTLNSYTLFPANRTRTLRQTLEHLTLLPIKKITTINLFYMIFSAFHYANYFAN
ncbi:hypothetical protein L596_006305 [Steinernema carpocapsae]|uniref:Uncharacterized protein n=1 Tax=Steinernema carpocapsae TaxID=34508 RepID=A0A4U8V7Y9_STECR|nr:hypothetical protein L596_006305 [Steinernema carpocapsae]